MPKISLVVVLRNERANLTRLLRHANHCFDELVVVHDGPESYSSNIVASKRHFDFTKESLEPETCSLLRPGAPPSIFSKDFSRNKIPSFLKMGYRLVTSQRFDLSLYNLVKKYRGKFFEGPRCFQQEPHWPFAWRVARHNWILRFDSDEYPSDEMRVWLRAFRRNFVLKNTTSGFTCRWPFWSGRREIDYDHLEWRPFLINKRRTAFIGLAEQGPIPLADWKSTGLRLHHRPNRKSFGLAYIVLRRQSYFWRNCIAFSLLKRPIDLPRWNYSLATWPIQWSQIIKSPWSTGLRRFIKIIFGGFAFNQNHAAKRPAHQIVALALHQLLLSWTYGLINLLHRFMKCLIIFFYFFQLILLSSSFFFAISVLFLVYKL